VKERLTHLKESVLTGSLFKALPLERVRDKRYREDEIHGYLNACAGQNKELRNSFYSARLCRNLFAELNTGEPEAITAHIDYLSAKIATVKPGGMNPEGILRIKTWIREWEAELVWAHFGIGIDHVNHLRLQFYSDDIFPQDPDYKRDVLPIVKLLDRIRPDIVTLALDPEGTGPDTHYKSLMALRSALETHVKETKNKTLRVWGYRNVWSRFHPSEVNKIVPISLNSFAVLHNMFNTCFLSQRSASFPSHEFNGPFNKLVQKIWVDQFNACAGLLGAGTFYNQDHPLLRRAYGLVYLKDMTYSEFMRETDNLRRLTDQVGKEYNG
jgi:glucosamine-6-phosphate deaminase